jgi:hypothetical protein
MTSDSPIVPNVIADSRTGGSLASVRCGHKSATGSKQANDLTAAILSGSVADQLDRVAIVPPQ